MFFAAIANWLVTLAHGPPRRRRCIGSSCAYVRYVAHLYAYLWLVANPYPGFVGEEGEYPIDIRLPPPERAGALKTLVRIFLALPALVLASALGAPAASSAAGRGGSSSRSFGYNASGLGSSSGCSAGSRSWPAAGCRRASATPVRTASDTTRRRSHTCCC